MMKQIAIGDSCVGLCAQRVLEIDAITALFRFIPDHRTIRASGFKPDYANIAVSDVF